MVDSVAQYGERMAQVRRVIEQELAEILQRQTRLSRQIDELKQQYAELEGARKGLLRVVAKSETRSSGDSHKASRSGSRVPDPDRSEWWAWTLEYLRTAPIGGVTIEAVWQGANRAGHDVQRSTVKSTLSHAHREDKVRRVKSGRYASVESGGPSHAGDGPSNSFGEATE